mmetsp:Transcript_53837/g.85731  ORF Transcript_53837/g.85731 Transcript_53837/m.85731 type:complete len:83 (+) Transcript_53837:85-333(+)
MRAVWTVLFFVAAVALRQEHSHQDATIHDHSEHVEASASSEQKLPGCRPAANIRKAVLCPSKGWFECKNAKECKWCGEDSNC